MNPLLAAALEVHERLPDAREFALRNRVVLVRSPGGVPLDIALGAMPFEEHAVARASDFTIAPGVSSSSRAAPKT